MTTAAELRHAIVRFAVEEEGNTDASRYWRLVLPNWKGPYPKHWCGAFALVAIQRALHLFWAWEIKGINGNGHGFLFRLTPAKDPQPGDIAYRDKPYQHHAIVTEVDGDHVVTADGNSGGASPTRVTVGNRSPKSYWTFYSVETYVQDVLDREGSDDL